MKILRGTIFGGIIYFLLGWLVYGIILMNFYMASTNQCANKPAGEMIWWALILSTLFSTFLLTLILDRTKAAKAVDGLVTGAIFGSLLTASIDLSFWSMTTMYNSFGPIVVETLVSAILYSVTGMVIVLSWGKR